MKIFKELKKLGYIHYTEYTVEELDALELNNSHRIMEQALVLKWFREKYGLFSSEVYDRGLDNGKLPIIHSYSFRILNLNNFEDFYGDTFNTYEEAELACLNKLIEIIKNK
jgi:hypothetical protein